MPLESCSNCSSTSPSGSSNGCITSSASPHGPSMVMLSSTDLLASRRFLSLPSQLTPELAAAVDASARAGVQSSVAALSQLSLGRHNSSSSNSSLASLGPSPSSSSGNSSNSSRSLSSALTPVQYPSDLGLSGANMSGAVAEGPSCSNHAAVAAAVAAVGAAAGAAAAAAFTSAQRSYSFSSQSMTDGNGFTAATGGLGPFNVGRRDSSGLLRSSSCSTSQHSCERDAEIIDSCSAKDIGCCSAVGGKGGVAGSVEKLFVSVKDTEAGGEAAGEEVLCRICLDTAAAAGSDSGPSSGGCADVESGKVILLGCK